jgi:hypothetical protein
MPKSAPMSVERAKRKNGISLFPLYFIFHYGNRECQ